MLLNSYPSVLSAYKNRHGYVKKDLPAVVDQRIPPAISLLCKTFVNSRNKLYLQIGFSYYKHENYKEWICG